MIVFDTVYGLYPVATVVSLSAKNKRYFTYCPLKYISVLRDSQVCRIF